SEMRVRDYLGFCARIKGLTSFKERRRRLEYVIENCALEEVQNRHIHKLSKGYRQRVGLAQALIHKPPILILDEPSSGLDPQQIIEVRQLIRRLAGEHSILLSTHILPEASRTCDRVLIINRGKILAEDSTEQLTGKLRGRQRVSVLYRSGLSAGDPVQTIESRIGKLPGVTKVSQQQQDKKGPRAGGSGGEAPRRLDIEYEPGREDTRGELARIIVESGADLLEMRPQAMTLEEIFIRITAESGG
ncbi:MAG: ABC transporter ATP-binding protein, partial [Gemmatimonadota bacterium]|nr:ABC transporter ATP-binding protein [Gemmatimonadota bacterium]